MPLRSPGSRSPGSELAAELWDGCDAAVASRLAYPEVRAALAATTRNHDLGEHELDAAERAWDGYWAATRPVELTAAVEQHAGQLAHWHALWGADAVHLASALAIGDPDLVVAVWDSAPAHGRTSSRRSCCPSTARRIGNLRRHPQWPMRNSLNEHVSDLALVSVGAHGRPRAPNS